MLKVYVAYDNPADQPLAANLVAVLRKIGGMLVRGKVTQTGGYNNQGGVQLDGSMAPVPMDIELVPVSQPPSRGPNPNMYAPQRYSYELEYRDVSGYYGKSLQPMQQPMMTRDQARELVRGFKVDVTDIMEDRTPVKPTKPIVPKPDTTKTGVTVRQLDMWEDDHA